MGRANVNEKASLKMDGEMKRYFKMRVIVLKNSNRAADVSNETEVVNCAIKDYSFYSCTFLLLRLC